MRHVPWVLATLLLCFLIAFGATLAWLVATYEHIEWEPDALPLLALGTFGGGILLAFIVSPFVWARRLLTKWEASLDRQRRG